MTCINATLCYIRNDSRTLMLRRDKKKNDIHHGKWNGLGGKFEPGESPEDCVIREIREESGLTIKNPRLKGMITFPEFDGSNDWLVFIFTAHEFSGRLIDSREGHLEWIPDEKLLSLPLWEGDYIFLPWLDNPGVFSGKFTYQNGQLTEHNVTFYGVVSETAISTL